MLRLIGLSDILYGFEMLQRMKSREHASIRLVRACDTIGMHMITLFHWIGLYITCKVHKVYIF